MIPSVRARGVICHDRQPTVLAPAAIRFGLIIGCILERESLGALELGASVQAQARDARHREPNRPNVALGLPEG